MEAPTIKIASLCNFDCVHCLAAKDGEPAFMDFHLFEHTVDELRRLGFGYVGIAGGGEATLHPGLEDLMGVLVKYNMEFEILTNGYLFKERLLPLLRAPRVKKLVRAIGFSLDGAREETHDSMRREGSFGRVIEAMGLCRLLDIPFYVKTVVTNRNKEELRELLLLTSGMGAFSHLLISPMPTRGMVKKGEIPHPQELQGIWNQLLSWKSRGIFPILGVEGNGKGLFDCNAFRKFGVDHGGNYLICSNLGNVETHGGSSLGMECLGNLKDTGLKELVARHFKLLPEVLEWRLKRKELIKGSPFSLCYWCFCQFEKLDWLREWPDSPWSRGLLSISTV